MGGDKKSRVFTSIVVSNRIKDASAVEQRLLELAHTTDAKLTAPALADFAPCSIEDAAAVLDDLAARDQLGMEIEDDGSIVYQLRGRQKISAAVPRTAMAPAPIGHAALVRRGPSPILAAAFSAFIPGAGHLYTGHLAAAVMWFVVVGIGYALILPGLVLHLVSILSAAASARRLDTSPARLHLLPRAAHV